MLFNAAMLILKLGAALLIAIVFAFLLLITVYVLSEGVSGAWIIVSFTIPLDIIFFGVFLLIMSLLGD